MRDTRLLVIFFLFSFSFVSFLSFFSVSFFDAANEIFIACFFFSAFDDSNFSRPKLGIFEVSSLFVNVNENNDGYQIGETKQVAASWVRAYSTNIQTWFSPKRSSVWENLIPRFRRNFTRRIVFFWSQHDFGNALYDVFHETRVFVQVCEIEFQSSPWRFSLQ